MQTVAYVQTLLRDWARTFGPYLLLEVLLPGGTLLALLLFLYRRGPLVQRAGPVPPLPDPSVTLLTLN